MGDTYDADVRPGDVVRGHDGHDWGVESITHHPRLAVTLVRHGRRIVGYPPVGTEVVIVQRGQVPAGGDIEVAALEALRRLGPAELLHEEWRA